MIKIYAAPILKVFILPTKIRVTRSSTHGTPSETVTSRKIHPGVQLIICGSVSTSPGKSPRE
jgi:hypothetical protein